MNRLRQTLSKKLLPLIAPLLVMAFVGEASAADPAYPLPRAKPEAVGMSSQRLAAMGEPWS